MLELLENFDPETYEPEPEEVTPAPALKPVKWRAGNPVERCPSMVWLVSSAGYKAVERPIGQ